MSSPGVNSAISDLCDSFNEGKAGFLDKVESEVYSYIVDQGKQCIAVIRKEYINGSKKTDPDPTYRTYTYEMHLDEDLPTFVEVLIKFVRGKRHLGDELDSALTDPVIKIIEKNYVAYYQDRQEEISEAFLSALRDSDLIRRAFVEKLTDQCAKTLSKHARKRIIEALSNQLHHIMSTQASHTITTQVSHLAATGIGYQVAHLAAQALVHALKANVVKIVAHHLASMGFKKILTIAMHKCVAVAVSVAAGKVLLGIFGTTLGSAFMWILIPIMVAIIWQQWKSFPGKLASGVSESVRRELDSNFGTINKNILEKTFDNIMKGPALIEAIAKDKGFQEIFREMVD